MVWTNFQEISKEILELENFSKFPSSPDLVGHLNTQGNVVESSYVVQESIPGSQCTGACNSNHKDLENIISCSVRYPMEESTLFLPASDSLLTANEKPLTDYHASSVQCKQRSVPFRCSRKWRNRENELEATRESNGNENELEIHWKNECDVGVQCENEPKSLGYGVLPENNFLPRSSIWKNDRNSNPSFDISATSTNINNDNNEETAIDFRTCFIKTFNLFSSSDYEANSDFVPNGLFALENVNDKSSSSLYNLYGTTTTFLGEASPIETGEKLPWIDHQNMPLVDRDLQPVFSQERRALVDDQFQIADNKSSTAIIPLWENFRPPSSGVKCDPIYSSSPKKTGRRDTCSYSLRNDEEPIIINHEQYSLRKEYEERNGGLKKEGITNFPEKGNDRHDASSCLIQNNQKENNGLTATRRKPYGFMNSKSGGNLKIDHSLFLDHLAESFVIDFDSESDVTPNLNIARVRPYRHEEGMKDPVEYVGPLRPIYEPDNLKSSSIDLQNVASGDLKTCQMPPLDAIDNDERPVSESFSPRDDTKESQKWRVLDWDHGWKREQNGIRKSKTERKGFITTCKILPGVWDDKIATWRQKQWQGKWQKHINSLEETISSRCKKEKEQKRSEQLSRVNIPPLDRGEANAAHKADKSLLCENCYTAHEAKLDGTNLGPKFFAEICNLWPDIIARLALDVHLDQSQERDEETVDSPQRNRQSGVETLKHDWSRANCLNNNVPSDTFSTKCSTDRESWSQSASNGIATEGSLKSSYSGRGNTPWVTRNGSDAFANENTKERHTTFTLPKSAVLEGMPIKYRGRSPICGSPRPRTPIPMHDLESLDSEDEDEILTSFIDDDFDDEEKEEDERNSEETRRNRQLKKIKRRLPEIPGNMKSFSSASILSVRTPSLAEEILEAESGVSSRSPSPEADRRTALSFSRDPIIVLKCHSYLRDDSSSPDSDLRLPLQDIDSGHSTQHSPDGAIPMSPQVLRDSPLCSSIGVPPSHIQLLDATHRGLYKFIPRHPDELEIEIGDPVYVQKEADDLWCEGVNLRTEKQGIFPAAYVTDVDYSDFDLSVPQVKKERYLLNYLGSIETLCHKGSQVLCQAVRKITREDGGSSSRPISCILEVSDLGIRMVDKRQSATKISRCHDYFYHLKHVSFCGFHPKEPKYFGFITKHPESPRFACHVFEAFGSARPIAEAVGRAFQRFYKRFIEAAFPTEDIYIE